MWQLPAIFFLSHTDWRLIVVEKKSSTFWRKWHSDAVDCLVFLMGNVKQPPTRPVLIPVYLSLYYFLVDSTHLVVCICPHTISPPLDYIYIYVEVQWFTVLEITILLSALFFTVGDCWLLAPPNQPVLLRVINNCFILEFCFCEGRLSKRHFQQKHHSLSVAGHILTVTWTKSWYPWKSFPLIFNRIIH